VGTRQETAIGSARALPGFQVFLTTGDLSAVSPAELFLFQDVNPANICSPAFVVNMLLDVWVHYPSSLHNQASVIAFADGHIERHRWTEARTRKTVGPAETLLHTDPAPDSPDLAWLRARTTTRK
jgi:prepilin-type processing-associated H-X9-DG protein